MSNRLIVREATIDDAEAISRVITRAVYEVNAKDYPPAVIAEVIQNFSPDRVAARMSDRSVFVATEDEAIIGTGSLEGATVRSVFVLPDRQGRGIGKALMSHIEGVARSQSMSQLEVPASITAEGFYRALGYTAVRDEYYGEERTIIMRKPLN